MSLPELNQLEEIIESSNGILDAKVLLNCSNKHQLFPIYSVRVGKFRPELPTICLVGGIHGIERIGTQILLAFLDTLINRYDWDDSLHSLMDRINVLFLPLMNPVGMHKNRRANGNGVDLMRNSPVEAKQPVFLAGGQRISSLLPWFRGNSESPMERESVALIEVIQREVMQCPFSLIIDCHSGFGMHDRIWFPYARCKQERMPHLAEVFEINRLLRSTYPNLNYIFEPQSKHYVTHGDIWDHIYDQAVMTQKILLPLTLELGSWLWVKKNPMQLRNALGMFHPIKPHRVKRVLRHHQLLMDFFLRITQSYESWLPEIDRGLNEAQAEDLWYQS